MAWDETKHFEQLAVRWWNLGRACDSFLSWSTVSAWFSGAAMMAHDQEVDNAAWFLSRIAATRAGVHQV